MALFNTELVEPFDTSNKKLLSTLMLQESIASDRSIGSQSAAIFFKYGSYGTLRVSQIVRQYTFGRSHNCRASWSRWRLRSVRLAAPTYDEGVLRVIDCPPGQLPEETLAE